MKVALTVLVTIAEVCVAMQAADDAVAMMQLHKDRAEEGLVQDAVPQVPQHFWPHALSGAASGQYGITHLVVPHNLSAHLAWTWHHPEGRYKATIAGGPVIDKDKNLYLTTSNGVWKLNENGELLWNVTMPNKCINNQPALLGNKLFLSTKDAHGIALDMVTGNVTWVKSFGTKGAGGDSGYPAAYDGLFVFGVDYGHNSNNEGGNMRVVAADSETGEQVWEYNLDIPTWNFAPLFPGDDTVVFMDMNGGVYRIGLHNGTEIWSNKVPGNEKSFSDGGVIIGENDVAYACSNPQGEHGSEGSRGVLRAFQLSDGKQLWEKMLPQACNSWPAVGRLGNSKELSVVVPVGNFMMTKIIHGGMMAFDAMTGAPQWQYQAPVFLTETGMAVGDIEPAPDAPPGSNPFKDREDNICLPAHWSAATITGDGAVIAGRSDGKIYRVKGPAVVASATELQNFAAVETSIDFRTTSGVEVETFDAHGSFLHGSNAFAPGMMASATCTDTLYVFKY